MTRQHGAFGRRGLSSSEALFPSPSTPPLLETLRAACRQPARPKSGLTLCFKDETSQGTSELKSRAGFPTRQELSKQAGWRPERAAVCPGSPTSSG